MFLSKPTLIKLPPRLLILDTFLGPRPTIWNPSTYLALNTMFFEIGVFFVITGWGKKKQNVRFLISCAGVAVCGRLLVDSVRLLVVCSRILLVCGRLWSFVVVCGRLLSLPVLVAMIEICVNIRNFTKWIEISLIIRIVRFEISLTIRNTV